MSDYPGSQRQFRSLLWRAVFVPVASLIGVALLLASAVGRLLEEAAAVQRVDEILTKAHECLKLGVDMETGVRGFQITGNQDLLQTYFEGARKIADKFAELERAVADPEARRKQTHIEEAHQAWAAFARELIRLREQGEDVQRVPLNLEGKELFDRFRTAFDDFIATEDALKRRRAERFSRTYDRLLPGWVFLLAVLGTGIGWYTSRQMAAVAAIFRRAERAAEQRAGEFQAIFDHASVGVVQLDPATGRFVRCNRAFCSLVGYSHEQLVGLLSPDDLTHADDLPANRPRLARMLEGQIERYAAETRYVRRDGGIVWVSVMTSLIRDKDNRPLTTVGVVVDLTGRRAAEEALRVSEDRLRLATEGADVGTWDWDLTTRTLVWSENCKGMFGLPADRPVTHADFLSAVYPEDRPRVEAALAAALEVDGDGRYTVELRTRRPDGTPRWISSRGSVHFDRAGRRPVRFSGSAVDITELKNAEERLRAARDELEDKVVERTRALATALEKAQEVDRLKSEFLATMSHELRTPLNSVIGFTEILLAGIPGPVNEEQKRQLGFVHRSGLHLLQLISDLLDLARIESGKVSPYWETFDPAVALREAVDTVRPLAEKKSLQLNAEIDLPPSIRTDRKMYFQVVLNLLSNAVKFTERGAITLQSHLVGDQWITRVSDTGIGIKPAELALLFEAFRQVDGSAQRRYQGTGLGLHLCRKIVTLLGGEIHGESESGRGSTFTFTLPAEASS